MCGLAGVIGSSINGEDFSNFSKLLYISAFRGTDSTGVVVVPHSNKDDPYIIKDVVDPASFITYNPDYDSVEPKKCFALLGHTRSATEGSVNLDNAQPVSAGSLMGTHNGTISHLADKKNDISDSRNLYKNIAEKGVAELGDITKQGGAFALVWYDSDTGCVNIIRNDKRPLFYARHNGVIYYASEKAFLQLVLTRTTGQVERTITIEEFEYGVLYQIKKNNGFAFRKDTVFTRPTYVHTNYSLPAKGGQAQAEGASPFRRATATTTTAGHTPTTIILSGELDRHLRISTVIPDWKKEEGKEVKKEEGKKVGTPPLSGTPSSHGGDGVVKDRKKKTGKIAFLHPYSNIVHNMDSMLKATENGCSCCSESPTDQYLREYPLHWFNSNEYLCDTCHRVNDGFGLRATEHSIYPSDN